MAEIKFPSDFHQLPDQKSGFRVTLSDDFSISESIHELSEISSVNLTQSQINNLYQLIQNMKHLSSEQRNSFIENFYNSLTICIDSIQSSDSSSLAEITPQQKNNSQILLYFFLQLVLSFEQSLKSSSSSEISSLPKSTKATKVSTKKKSSSSSSSGFQWIEWRSICLDYLQKYLSFDQTRLWPMGIIHENVLMPLWKFVLQLLEEKPIGINGTGKHEVTLRKLCQEILIQCVKQLEKQCSQHSTDAAALSTFLTALIDSICRYEHMGTHFAEICSAHSHSLSNGHGGNMTTQVCNGIMKEIGRINMTELSKSNATGVKNIGSFLVTLAEIAPHITTQYLPFILNDLDSEAYQIRSSLVTAIGSTIIYIFKECQQSTQPLPLPSAFPDSSSSDSDSHPHTLSQSFSHSPSLSSLIHLRDELLDILTERTRDMNSFTRATVLKVWCHLLEKEVIPVNRIGPVAELAVDRLCDKTAIVRKSAIGLITCLLDYNPFSGDLNAEHYKELKSMLEKTIAERMDIIRKKNNTASTTQAQAQTERRRLSCSVKDLLKDEEEKEEEDEEEEEEEGEEEEEEDISAFTNDSEIYKLTTELSKCHSCLELLQAINTALPTINLMLISKTSSDVIEALRFFTRAVNFGINGSATCLLGSLSLIWHQDESIQTECLNSFLNVFITDGGATGASTSAASGATTSGSTSVVSASAILPPTEIANNLVTLAARLVSEFSYSEIISLEKIISEIFKRQFIPNSQEVIAALWSLSLAAHHSQQHTLSQGLHGQAQGQGASRSISGPLFVLKMIASFGVDVGFAQVGKIKFICNSCFPETSDPLGPSPELDLETIRIAAMCFQSSLTFLDTCSSSASPSPSNAISSTECLSEVQYSLLAASERLVAMLADKYGQWDTLERTRQWFATAEEAIYALFRLHPSPEEILTRLLLHLFLAWKQSASETHQRHTTDATVVCRLSRFLFLLGQGLLGVLLHTEQMATLSKTMKEKHKQQQLSGGPAGGTGAGKAVKKKSTTAKGKGKKKLQEEEEEEQEEQEEEEEVKVQGKGSYQESEEVDAMEEEMGMAAAVDADDEKKFNAITEYELTCHEDRLLSQFHPMVAFILSNPNNQYSHPLLRETAILCFCRYLTISSTLCEQYLSLFFTILSREPTEQHRVTMMITIGDLSIRFPNLIEPWTLHLYQRLQDTSVLVRENTLMILIHLILNDMIKVKGQISFIVMCLTDESDKIRALTQLFFVELAKRSNNPVYNLLGDIIGNLSRDQDQETPEQEGQGEERQGEEGQGQEGQEQEGQGEERQGEEGQGEEELTMKKKQLSSKEFQEIMSFVLSFVTKDKQADSLLERLMIRMIATDSMKQKRNLCFCISRLPITDKGVKKMTELLRQTKECLFDSEILESFRSVASRAKKTMKVAEGNEVKEALNEFEAFVASVLQSTDSENIPPDELQLDNGEGKDKEKEKKTKTRTTKRTATAGTKKSASASSVAGKSVRVPRKKKTEVVYESEEEEEESDDGDEDGDEEEVQQEKKTTRRPREVLQSRSSSRK